MGTVLVFVGSFFIAATSDKDPVQALVFGVGLWLIFLAFLPSA